MSNGLTTDHIRAAMRDFVGFLGFINHQMHTRDMGRLEAMLAPANFSSIVGEFMDTGIPKHCPTLVKNRYHNGHPDLLPAGMFPNDAAQHAGEGIEIKGARYLRGWQGHNPEDTWLMVFVFDSNRPVDAAKGVAPKPFRFVRVAGALLKEADWTFSGPTGTSRRTITASVTPSGYEKMMANWIYGPLNRRFSLFPQCQPVGRRARRRYRLFCVQFVFLHAVGRVGNYRVKAFFRYTP